MKIIIWGTGIFYLKRRDQINKNNIIGFVDNNVEKQGTYLDGKRIYAPEEIAACDFDFICIMTPKYKNEIEAQILELGISKDKIKDFAELENEICQYYNMQVFYTSKNEEKDFSKSVILVSHELSLTGAPIVLFNLAILLKDKGYKVTLLSKKDGPLKYEYLNNEIDVYIKEWFSAYDVAVAKWLHSFDIMVACTLVVGNVVKIVDGTQMPVLWWLHESEAVYKDSWSVINYNKIGKNVSVYCGGMLPLQTYQKYFKTKNGKILLYGVPDRNREKKRYALNEKMIFAVIALWQPRKGQDLFVKAIQKLDKDCRRQAEFWLVGGEADVNSEFSISTHEMAKGIPEIKVISEVTHKELIEIYKKIDVLVVPSREDPMPVVVPESMMFYKTCIVSTGVGTSAFIEDKYNGLVCSPNPVAIAKNIEWLIKNRHETIRIGKEGRKLYEEVFSQEAFEKNVLAIIDSMLK